MAISIFEPQHEFLKYFFNSLNDAFILFDIDGSLKHINNSFLSLIPVDQPESLLKLNLFTDFQLTHQQQNAIKGDAYTEINLQFNKYHFITSNHLTSDSDITIDNQHLTTFQLTTKNIDQQMYLITIKEDTTIYTGNSHLLLKDDQLSLALNLANIGMLDWNFIDNTIHFSEIFYHWFDYDIHYISNDANAIFSLIHPDDVEQLQRDISHYEDTVSESNFHEFRIRQNEEDYIWVRISGHFFHDVNHHPIRFGGIINNITKEKLNTIELESERNDIDNLYNNMNTGFALHRVILNDQNEPVDFEYVYTNPAYEQLTMLSSKSLMGKTLLDIIPDLEPEIFNHYGRVALHGETAHFTEYVKSLKRYFDFIVYQTEPHYFAVIFSDVTEKIRAEKALAQGDKMNSIGQLAGGIAHDFNNHLQIIRGYSEILDDKLKETHQNELREHINKIQLSVKHSSNMIKQLLAFSKDDHYIGKPMDFHLMLHQTKHILSYTLNKNINIQLFLEANNYQLIGDDSLLQNAIINMCLNSRDALPNGGQIRITTRNIIYAKDTIVGLTKLKAGNYLICSIHDDGNGIAAEDINHIFEPFFTTKSNKGTGMGLAAVFGTVKHHHGAIDVTSQEGEWSNFDIYLPTSDEKVTYTYTKRPSTQAPQSNYKILLVDDEPVITMVMEQYLAEQGHQVSTFNTPNNVLENFNSMEFDFDLVLLDVIMPEMSGFDLLEELILLKPDIKVIFLSGYYNTNNVSEGAKKNILDFIEKPVNLTELNDKIQRLMHKENS